MHGFLLQIWVVSAQARKQKQDNCICDVRQRQSDYSFVQHRSSQL